MTHAIGYVVYGINLKEPEWAPLLQEAWFQNLRDDQAVQTHYSGSGEGPVYIGVDLNRINECSDVDLEELLRSIMVMNDHRNRWRTLVQRLCERDDVPEQFRVALQNASPTRFLTWGTS